MAETASLKQFLVPNFLCSLKGKGKIDIAHEEKKYEDFLTLSCTIQKTKTKGKETRYQLGFLNQWEHANSICEGTRH